MDKEGGGRDEEEEKILRNWSYTEEIDKATKPK